MRRIAIAAASIAAALITAFMAPPVKAQGSRVQIGTLRCSLSSSIGMVVGSQRNVSCIFGADNAPDEAYEGRLTKIGVNRRGGHAASGSGANALKAIHNG